MKLRTCLCVVAVVSVGAAAMLSRGTIVHAAPRCQTLVIDQQYQSAFQWFGGRSNGRPSYSAITSPGVGCASIIDVAAPAWIKTSVSTIGGTASLDYHVLPLTDPLQSRSGSIFYRTVIGGIVSPRLQLVINQNACSASGIPHLLPNNDIVGKGGGRDPVILMNSCDMTGSSPVSWATVRPKPNGTFAGVVILVDENPSILSRDVVLQIAGLPFQLHQEGWAYKNILNIFYGKIRSQIENRVYRKDEFYIKKPSAVTGRRG